jgi:type II secretory pathway pseudopilin PulG
MMMLTVLNILVAAALPKWSHVIRREKEEELISRGFQYAEAFRIFQNRFQRLPNRLEELIEVEPRSIRKLWKDPMTDDGTWVLLRPGNDPATPPPPNMDPDGRGGDAGEPGDGEPGEEVPGDTGIGGKKGPVQIGPFAGVRSRSTKESILIFNGHDHYDQWHFTVEMLTQGGGNNQMPPGGAGGNPAQGGGLQLSTRWLGRPLPQFLQAAQDGMPQDGQPPGGQPPGQKPRRPPPQGAPGGGTRR